MGKPVMGPSTAGLFVLNGQFDGDVYIAKKR
jgi:hypothetical protein